ncbi:MAG: LytTR family DNA-binding domain-containing protein [Cyclobacteriaceae bacterium]
MISDRKLLILLAGLLTLVFFESGQQYYYVVTFGLNNDPVSYWDILQGHAYRWGIWLLLSTPFWYWLSHKAPANRQWYTIIPHVATVFIMLNINFLFMSLLQVWRFGDAYTMSDLSELYVFYGYQKGPIYLLAYLLTYFYLFYERRTQAYELLVQDHQDLKHLLELDKADSSTNEISVLTAKIGDSKHLIPIEQIMFIAADDYCVNIHTEAGRKFVLRASLKQLERDLPEGFIRVHRSYMVNFKFMTELRLGDTRPHLLVNTGQSIPVARSRCAELNGLVNRPMRPAV